MIKIEIHNLTVPAPEKIKELVGVACEAITGQILHLVDPEDSSLGYVSKGVAKTRKPWTPATHIIVRGSEVELHLSKLYSDEIMAEKIAKTFDEFLLDVTVTVSS